MIEIILWVIYGLVAIGFGWWAGRDSYLNGEPGSAGWAFFSMIIFGGAWPLLAIMFVFYVIFTAPWIDWLARKIFR